MFGQKLAHLQFLQELCVKFSCFFGNISAKNYQNRLTYVEVIAK